ncbi:Six-hairpin glycosidase [Corynespora cassiicola Philippines]|uniref:Six-hairpin glycosidase n=1 Tax=Corynespora cassiicola Philippines TaxID=1448308 RepID=A0A2T2NK28_CORCC|nr:Six-hairpin glycosidase [Corynespora cassiicola Philippines]
MSIDWETAWIWHPDWTEKPDSPSAGAFVHFRKSVHLDQVPTGPINISITADTRYKLYINSRFIHAGPVKGDQQAWFYDVLNIQPHLRVGRNSIVVHVLRFYHGSQLATSFPRTSYPGLYIKNVPTADDQQQNPALGTDGSWEAAIDPCRVLPASGNFDFFLQIFEKVDQRESHKLQWVPAKPYKFMTSYGLAAPWNLRPRMIPFQKLEPVPITALNNIGSSQPREAWEQCIDKSGQATEGIVLPKSTIHHIEIGVDSHTTAYVKIRFARPSTGGSSLDVTWSEGYEDSPIKLPFERQKGDRADTSKFIVGPKDWYTFAGKQQGACLLEHDEAEKDEEIFAPFHFRTFRYFALDIKVADDSDLVLKSIEITKTNYPLQVSAGFNNVSTVAGDPTWFPKLWDVSLRTLENCMHDCYEDCPFFEQLQYAMDTRSSSLFTYFVSRDDRLPRQAIVQLYNSFQPALGLTASRAPSHHLQIISHFSLFWACMVTDHYEHFADASFASQFLPVIDAVLDTFDRRRDPETGLIRVSESAIDWNFVDWSDAYKPFGIPPAAKDTGFITYSSQLYAYTLQRLSLLQYCLGKPARAIEYERRAELVVQAVRDHCYDGTYFTDGLAKLAKPSHYSEHSQVWAVLCGAVAGKDASELLSRSLPAQDSQTQGHELTKVSIAQAFYSLRALSAVGGDMYDAHFDAFWQPWRDQITKLNLTTWVEDYVTGRSDCHAWGSLPLYEYTAEVAGLKPSMTGGERALTFKPRVGLFKTFDGKVPVAGSVDRPVIARVQWQHNGKVANLSISWEGARDVGKNDNIIPVRVTLPDGKQEILQLFEDKQWQVSLA